MVKRRRIDWSEVPGIEPDVPVWSRRSEPSQVVELLNGFSDVFLITNTNALLKRAVELCLERVGFVRAGVYLYDEPANLLLGTWGTNLNGEVVDERYAMFDASEDNRHVFERAVLGDAHWTVVEDCPIVDQTPTTTHVIGNGWVCCTPIWLGSKWLGMLYNDAALTGAPVDSVQQGNAAVLCYLVAAALQSRHHSNQFFELPSMTARHPTLRRAVHRLSHDPSLGGEELARPLGMSLSRLARLFREEIGVSLVEYRNRLRLERFMTLMRNETDNLLQAALAAGFGSYAQFHRVFRSAYSIAPREYFAARRSQLPSTEDDDP